MAPGFPPNFWQDYRKRIESDVAQIRSDLERMESGKMTLGERIGHGPWRDVTGEMIERHKRNIATFGAILADLDKRGIS